MNACRYLLLFFLLNGWITSFPQKGHIQFEHIGTNLGLSQSTVICVLEDSRGFMWFGTRDGLNKYDGYKFIVYKYDAQNVNSLSHNIVYDIIEDHDGYIWIATWGGGLDKFDWKTEKFTHYNNKLQDPHTLGIDYINKLLEDKEGDIWVGTEGGGLSKFDKKSNLFNSYLHDPTHPGSISNDKVKDIKEDRDHNIWVTTDVGGVDLFDRKNKTFRHFQTNVKNSASLASNLGGCLLIDNDDQVWVGTRGGLTLFDKKEETFTVFINRPKDKDNAALNTIKVITQVDNNNLWLGTENGGISIFNMQTRTFRNYAQDDADNSSLSDNSISDIYKDRKGNIWVGTFSGGLNFLNNDANKFTHYRHTSSPQSLKNNKVLAILEDSKENLWIGTDGGGMDLFDPLNGTFTHYLHDPVNKKSLSGNYVLSIFEDHEGNLWIGTWGNGITVFNKDKNTFKYFTYDPLNSKGLSSPNIKAISEDAEKNIWIMSFGAGISQYDKKNDSFIHYSHDPANVASLGNNFVNLILEDKEQNFWAGTNGNGLNQFNKKTKVFTHFFNIEGKNSISNNDVNCMIKDVAGNLWLGTGRGLNKMDKNGRFTAYYVKDGLPSNSISGLLIDKKGNLWISTLNGISRFNPTSKVFTNFGINDGLQSTEFKNQSCFQSHTGKMYFGGINGFNEFSPDSIQEKIYEPALVFTDFQIFNKQVPISEDGKPAFSLKKSITDTKELVLSYAHSVISFEFASLNYTVPEKKQYSYMLENFDKGWNDIGTRHSATYTNLDPGKYVLKVRGLNNEGKWSSNMAEIKITITPPYWKTWWFQLALFIFIIGGAIAFYQYRINIVESQKKQLQEKVQDQTVLLVNLNEEERMARVEAEQARSESEIARQNAYHVNEELQIKNKELEQFAYVASHDLQEPLRTTAGFAELMQQQYHGKIDSKADKYLGFILESTARMKVLINDLLDFSRIGTKVELKKIDCNIVLKNMLADISAAIQDAKADIQYSELPVIMGYPTEIKLLFQNLVINGIKFRKKDTKPEIRISAVERAHYWEFAIADNGIGIEKKYSERIFDIFQRLHTRADYEGSGIGLAHCKKIVELHKGKIWVNSTPGQGTTFHFNILKLITNATEN